MWAANQQPTGRMWPAGWPPLAFNTFNDVVPIQTGNDGEAAHPIKSLLNYQDRAIRLLHKSVFTFTFKCETMANERENTCTLWQEKLCTTIAANEQMSPSGKSTVEPVVEPMFPSRGHRSHNVHQ